MLQLKNKTRRIILLAGALMCLHLHTQACDACEKQQPAFTRGITHGAGPTSGADWIIVGLMIVVSATALCLSGKYLLRPGEKEKHHIKHSIFE